MPHARTLCVSAAVLAAVLATPAAQGLQKEQIAGVTNLTHVTDAIACAGSVDASALGFLKQMGFVTIVNLRLPEEVGANVDAAKAEAEKVGLKYFHLPFSSRAPAREPLEAFLRIVADPSNRPLLLHCAMANRAAGFWAVARVLQDGWPVDKAIAEAEAIGLTNPQLKAFVLEYLKSKQQ